jgi:hypothetical protein
MARFAHFYILSNFSDLACTQICYTFKCKNALLRHAFLNEQVQSDCYESFYNATNQITEI